MKGLNRKIKDFTSLLLAVMMVMSVFSPLFVYEVYADNPAPSASENNSSLELQRFEVSLISGADDAGGKYVWKPVDYRAGHRFVYRIEYVFSGTGTIPKGGISFTVPKHVLRNRSGTFSDECELSVPRDGETGGDGIFSYHEDGENMVVTNYQEVMSAQDGYIEFAYDTTEQTYEYRDDDEEAYMAPTVDLVLQKQGESPITVSKTAKKVVIDTAVEIASVSKKVDYARASREEWDSSWGTKPADADEYKYVEWTIYTELSQCTQPFDFTLTDDFNVPDAEIVGYKLSGEKTFSMKRTAAMQISRPVYGTKVFYRYDYVLTRHKKSTYPAEMDYSIPNKITAVVTPYDRVDAPSQASASWEYINVPNSYTAPTGSFWSEKYASTLYNYDLDELKNGMIPFTEENLYYDCYLSSHSYIWTLPEGEEDTNIEAFGKSKVKFEITDENVTFNGDQRKLTSEDYSITSLDFAFQMNDGVFNPQEQHFSADSNVQYADGECFVVEAKFGDDMADFAEVGRYYFKTDRVELNNQYRSKVSSMGKGGLIFKEDADCTAFRFWTENVHYYTRIDVYPHFRLKASPYILNAIGNHSKVYLKNESVSKLFAHGNSEPYFNRVTASRDVLVGKQRNSYLNKELTSSINNKVDQYVLANWRVTMRETIEDDGTSEYIEQSSGRFYDLLPVGMKLDPSSVQVETENGLLSKGAFRVTEKEDYNGTGRTMVIIDISQSGKIYYVNFSTIYSWTSLRAYGKYFTNSIAYETGNRNIGGGFPDDGGNIDEKNLMAELDSSTNDKKFIYAQRVGTFNNIIINAATGLSKKVMSRNDMVHTQSTVINNNTEYSYEILLSTHSLSRAKNIFFYDSLENYVNEGTESDWRGVLKKVDLTQPKQLGIVPVVYYSPVEKLNLSANDYDNCCLQVTDNGVNNQAEFSCYNTQGQKIWYTEEEMNDLYGGISAAKAVCVDLRYKNDGTLFVMDTDSSVVVYLKMVSPQSITSEVKDPRTYNNIYAFNTVVGATGAHTNAFIYQNFTELHYRIGSSFGIYKGQSGKLDKPLEGISFCLSGVSDYGKDVYIVETTNSLGRLDFTNVEKGTYRLYEVEGNADYQAIKDEMVVVIDNEAVVTIDGKSVERNSTEELHAGTFTDGYYTIPNEPRIHADISVYKKDIGGYHVAIQGAKFRLSGTSNYGNSILMYGESDAEGKVLFENLEIGTYTLIETQPAEGYMSNNTDYTVTVDSTGSFSITNVKQEKDGTLTIYNEPYHNFTIQKTDYTTGRSIGGAEFTLTGTSDLGTEVNITRTAGAVSGRVTFSRLERGTYILRETLPPEGYFPDNTKRVVTITADDTVTISGLKQNDAGNFVIENKRNGTVTILKKWEDDKKNEERPVPVIHLSTTKQEAAATFKEYSEPSQNGLRRYFSSEYGYSTQDGCTAFRPWTETETVPEGVTTFRMDDEKTEYQILGWFDNGTFYWWSDAQVVYFPEGCHQLFAYMSKAVTIDCSKINTSKVKNMESMFQGCTVLENLRVSDFDTSNVTSMYRMFYECNGLKNLNLTSFNTSDVTDMSYMFYGCIAMTAPDLSSFDTSNVKNMSYMFYNCAALPELHLDSFNTHNVTDMVYMFYNCRTLQNLDLSRFDTSNAINMNSMFSYCSGLTNIDLSSFDTSNAINMNSMFSYCSSLTSLDLRNFNTPNLQMIGHMFSYCSSLTSVNLSTLDTSNVENMAYLFGYCTALQSVDLSNFDTSKVKSMEGMFRSCKSLESLDLSNFDTSRVENFSLTFDSCEKLKSLDLRNFRTSHAVKMTGLFAFCTNLETLNISSFDTSHVTEMDYMFEYCSKIKTIDISNFDTENVTKFAAMFERCSLLETIYVSELWDMSNRTDSSRLFDFDSKLKGGQGTVSPGTYPGNQYARIDDRVNNKPGLLTYKTLNTGTSDTKEATFRLIEKKMLSFGGISFSKYTGSDEEAAQIIDSDEAVRIDDYRTSYKIYIWKDASKNVYWWSDADHVYLPANCDRYFAYKGNLLRSVSLNDIDASRVESMAYMFSPTNSSYSSTYLTTVDLSNIDASNVKNMEYMFSRCTSLQQIDLTNFRTTNAVNMSYMFTACYGLKNLDLSSFSTANVTNMAHMFDNDGNLETLDVSSFDTSNVTDMFQMFSGCRCLKSLDIRHFNTSKVTTMRGMFWSCVELETLDLSNLDTSNVTNMEGMFYECRALKELNLSNFNTSNVTNMRYMFGCCSVLESLDLSNFNTSNVTDMSYMFNDCYAITDIDFSSFDTSNVTDMSYMFFKCRAFESIDLSSFDVSSVRNMDYMFNECSALKELDLSGFDTQNVTSMTGIFTSDGSLTTIYVSELWTVKKISDYYYYTLFGDNTSLVGGKGTPFDNSNRTRTYARIDNLPDEPGYLTYKAAPESAVQHSDAGDVHYISDTEQENGVRMADGTIPAEVKCVIDKEAAENTWSYTFTGINDKVRYYVWEEEPEGYTGSATEDSPGIVVSGTFTITNVAPHSPKYGSLIINKLLTAEEGAELVQEDYAVKFLFTVTFTDENNEPVTGTKIFGNVPFSNGKAVVRLSADTDIDDNSVLIPDIPANWNYTVTEEPVEGYELISQVNDTGIITAETEIKATFTNLKKYEPDTSPKADVTLKKLVRGNALDTTQKFSFTTALTGLKPNGKYSFFINNDEQVDFNADRTGSADITLSLSNNETAVFRQLPVGSHYCMIEAGGDYIASYLVADDNNKGLIASTKGIAYQKNSPLSTAVETVDKDEAVTVTFTNELYVTQNLTLKKVVKPSSGANNDPFTFTLDVAGLSPDQTIQSDVGTLQADSNGALSVQFVMKDGETVVIRDLPVQSKYCLKEWKSPYIASYEITDSADLGKIVRSADANTEINADLSTQWETVDQDEDAVITFTNTKLQHDITVTKIVDMTNGDGTSVNYKAQKFHFRVSFSHLTPGRMYTMAYTSADMTGSVEETFVADGEDYDLLFDLQDGQSLTVRDLAEGVHYKVTELYDASEPLAAHFIPSYEISYNEQARIAQKSDALDHAGSLSTAEETVDVEDLDINIVFTNSYTFTPYTLPDSGFEDTRPVYAAAFAGAVLFGFAFMYTMRKGRKKRGASK